MEKKEVFLQTRKLKAVSRNSYTDVPKTIGFQGSKHLQLKFGHTFHKEY